MPLRSIERTALALLLPLALTGCAIEPPPVVDAAVFSQSRFAGQSAESIRPGQPLAFDVQVPAGKTLEVLANPTDGATAVLLRAESPDGQLLVPPDGQTAATDNGQLSVSSSDIGLAGRGLRFLGRSDVAGSWHIVLNVQATARDAALRRAVLRSDLFAKTQLLVWLLERRERDVPPAAMLTMLYPELAAALRPIDVSLTLNIGDIPIPAPIEATAGESSTTDESTPADADTDTAPADDATAADAGDSDTPSDAGGLVAGSDVVASREPPTQISTTLVVQTGAPVPDQPGATFTVFSNPILDADGRVAFWGAYRGGNGNGGLYVWGGDKLTRILDSDPTRRGQVPSADASVAFGNLTIDPNGRTPQMVWGSRGRLVFAAQFNRSASPNGLFRWRASDGNMIRISDCTQLRTLIPGVGSTFLCEFMNPSLSHDGVVLFANRYSYMKPDGAFVMRVPGLFTSNGSATTPLAVPELAAPSGGRGDNTVLKAPELLPVMSGSGTPLFQATFTGDAGDRALYRTTAGRTAPFLDNAPGRFWPGLAPAVQVGGPQPFDAIAIGDGDHVAVDTTLTAGGVTHDAVLLSNPLIWRELRGDGADASDLLSGVNAVGQCLFLAAGRPYLANDAGTVALAAAPEWSADNVTWLGFGGAINDLGRGLLRFKRNGSEAPGLAFWTGAGLLVVADVSSGSPAGNFQHILYASRPTLDAIDRAGVVKDRPEVDLPGRSGALNDRDQMVFRVRANGSDGREGTSDDYQAIYFGQAR